MLLLRRVLLVGLILGVASQNYTPVAAVENNIIPSVIITELSPGFVTGKAAAEFVELANVSDTPIDLSKWSLQKLSASGTKSTYLTEIGGSIAPHTRLVLASAETGAAADQASIVQFKTSLSSEAGTLRVLDADGLTVDEMQWQAKAENGELYFTPCDNDLPPLESGEKSFKRIVNADKQWIDTPASSDDFCLSEHPTLQAALPEVDERVPEENTEIPETTPEPEPETPPVEDTAPEAPDNQEGNPPVAEPGEEEAIGPEEPLLPIRLSEFLVDPVSPQTDANDEFIELFNPNNELVDLAGYKLQAGSTWQYNHVFAEGTEIAPNNYVTVFSKDSPLTLANSGGQVRLLAPDGAVLEEVVYPSAKPGLVYAKNSSGVWEWSGAVTPGVQNSILAAAATTAVKTASAVAKQPAKAKTAVAKKAKAASVKSTKQKQPKNTTTLASATAPETAKSTPLLNPYLIGGLVLAVVGYGTYEYRHEIAKGSRKLIELAKTRLS